MSVFIRKRTYTRDTLKKLMHKGKEIRILSPFEQSLFRIRAKNRLVFLENHKQNQSKHNKTTHRFDFESPFSFRFRLFDISVVIIIIILFIASSKRRRIFFSSFAVCTHTIIWCSFVCLHSISWYDWMDAATQNVHTVVVVQTIQIRAHWERWIMYEDGFLRWIVFDSGREKLYHMLKLKWTYTFHSVRTNDI